MIQTTVVGSYPVPAWLRVYNTRESLRDAMLVVLKTQELAGIDVVADGELYRWDINHPETNGMIDYFVRPLQGVQVELTLDRLRAWRQKTGMAYRSLPAGIVTGPLGHGRLNLARDYALYRDLTPKPKKFTVTSPYMLAKVLDDAHYGSLGALVMALADLLKAQLAEIDAAVVQVDEANVTGHPDDGPIAAAGINRVLEGVATRPEGGSPLLRKLRWPDDPERDLRETRRIPERPGGRPRRPGDGPPARGRAGDVPRGQGAARPRDRSDRHQGQRGRDA